MVLGRTGGTTAGSNTIVADNNVIGRLIFTAADGVDMRVTPAEIRSSVDDSSPAADSIKGDLEFYTNDGSSVAPISRLIITPTGNVGIGTSAPSAPLQIYGSDNQLLKVTSTDAYAEICISDNTTTSTTSSAIGVLGDRLYLYTGGGQRLSVLGDGNVGIGTTNPTFAAVSGNTVKGLNIQNVGQDTQASLRLTGHNASGNPGVATYTELLHAGANLRFDINHNGTVRFSIAPAGAITFNSAFTFPTADGSAGQVLQTNGSGTVTWASVTGGGGVSGSGTDNYIPRWNGTTALQNSSIVALDSGIVGIGTNAPNAAGASTNNSILSLKGKATAYGGILELINYGTSGNGQSHGVIRFLDNTTENAQIEVLRHSAADDARMDFKTRATGGSLTTRLTIADDGKVGIGTNAPGSVQLDVRSTTVSGGSFDVQDSYTSITSGASSLWLSNSNQTAGNYIRINFADAVGGSSTALIAAKCTDHTNNYGDLQFWTRGSSGYGIRLHIDQEGSVGIGVTDPDAKLEIKGDGGGNGLTLKTTDDASNETFYIKDGGAVGLRYYPLLVGIPSSTNITGGPRLQIEEAGWLTVTSVGKVGLGTTAPNGSLDVVATGDATNPTIQVGYSTSSRANYRFGLYSDSEAGYISNKNGNNGIRFLHRGATVMQVGYGGDATTPYVGIGTTAPVAQLNLFKTGADDAISSSLYFQRAAGHYGCAILQVGNGSAGTEEECSLRVIITIQWQ